MPNPLRASLSLAGLSLVLTAVLPAQQSDDDPQRKTLTGLRSFAVSARVQVSNPASLPPVDEALLRSRLENAIRQAGMLVQGPNDVRNGTQAEVGLHYLVVGMRDSWGRENRFAASSCVEASQLVRLQRITTSGAPVYAVVPTWRSCGMLVGDSASFSGAILRNADEQIARFVEAWRMANAAHRAHPAAERPGG
jgi:hypothetical protein